MRTKNGRPLTDADLDRIAAEAEGGYDLSTWKRRRGRPSLTPAATGTSSPKIETRVPPSLRADLKRYAAEDGKTVSEVLRDLAEGYVASHKRSRRTRSQI